MNLLNNQPVNVVDILGYNKIPEKASILNLFRDPEKTTQRYNETDDLGVIKLLNDNNWFISKYQQMGTHNPEKAIYKPYMATYHNPNLPKLDGQGELTILQRGSKDGTKRFILDVGFFRFACLNGMITGNRLFEPVRIKHIGDAPDQLGALLEELNKSLPYVYNTITDMSRRDLSENQRYEFARKALGLRFKEDKQGVSVEDILKPRRNEDAGDSLWRTFNILQENLIKGGTFSYVTKNNTTRASRAITNIDLEYEINTGLWNLAEEYLYN
jgi:hypothetical protein